MDFVPSERMDGYRSCIKTDFPSGAVVYYTRSTMTQGLATPPMVTASLKKWGGISSTNVIVVGMPGNYLLYGALTAHRSMSIFNAVIESCRITAVEMFQPEIRAGEKPEETIVLQGADWRKLLKDYADAAARCNGIDAAIAAEKNMTGYCTWYYYYDKVTQQNTLENIDALTSNRDSYAAEYVQIDDGYQTFQGDWLDRCDSWPEPLDKMAEKIRRGGMKAGIWLMPTTASTASKVFNNHPDWFVKNEQGDVVTLPGWSPAPNNVWACLDATVPEVREYIANVFKTFRSWGFTYFKLDGLYFGFQKGVRRDPNATSVSAFRLLLKTIRETVPDCVILGCSEPFLPCLGLIDNARVSNDTGLYYKSLQPEKNSPRLQECTIIDAFNITMANFWMFDRWFRADPDVVMARQDNAHYTRNHAKISVLGAIMTGVALTSDHLGTINPDRLSLLAKAQNIRMRDAQPMKGEPDVWPMEFEGVIGGKRAVAVVNDSRIIRTWKLSELGFNGNCIDLLDDKKVTFELTLSPEDAVLLVEE